MSTSAGLTSGKKAAIGGAVGGAAAAGLLGGLLGGLLPRALPTTTMTATTTTSLVDALLSNLTENASSVLATSESAGTISDALHVRSMSDGELADEPADEPTTEALEALVAGSRLGSLPLWVAPVLLLGVLAGALVAALTTRGRAGRWTRAASIDPDEGSETFHVDSDEESQWHAPEPLGGTLLRAAPLGGLAPPTRSHGLARVPCRVQTRLAAAEPLCRRHLAEPSRAEGTLDRSWRSLFSGVFRRMSRGEERGPPTQLVVSPQRRPRPEMVAVGLRRGAASPLPPPPPAPFRAAEPLAPAQWPARPAW